jgi:hypothetical protein
MGRESEPAPGLTAAAASGEEGSWWAGRLVERLPRFQFGAELLRRLLQRRRRTHGLHDSLQVVD